MRWMWWTLTGLLWLAACSAAPPSGAPAPAAAAASLGADETGTASENAVAKAAGVKTAGDKDAAVKNGGVKDASAKASVAKNAASGHAPTAAPAPDVPVSRTRVYFDPPDETTADPSFAAFHARLLAAVKARDIDAVAAVADREIKLSFGGDWGAERFREWLIDNPVFDTGSYWDELERILELGATHERDGMFCMPAMSCVDPPDCPLCDPFETLFAITDRAPIYAAADANSKIVARIDHGVVHVIDTRSWPWSHVRAELPADDAGGAPRTVEGYVRGPEFRSQIDYRARFERRDDGVWRMTLFIAGD